MTEWKPTSQMPSTGPVLAMLQWDYDHSIDPPAGYVTLQVFPQPVYAVIYRLAPRDLWAFSPFDIPLHPGWKVVGWRDIDTSEKVNAA